jgi:hypothetical protein
MSAKMNPVPYDRFHRIDELATFRRKIAAGGADVGIAAFAENCKVGRI